MGLNAQVLGISVDHVPCLQAWADSLGGIGYPLLSDFWPHGAIAQQYGVLRAADGYTERAIFVIDREGIIRYIDIHAIDDRPDNEELRKVLREIQAKQTVKTMPVVVDVEEQAIPPADIVLYCARWCKDCRKAKAWLAEHNLEYVEVDIDYNMAARNQVRQWAKGSLVTPVIYFDGSPILDFNEPLLQEALRRRGG